MKRVAKCLGRLLALLAAVTLLALGYLHAFGLPEFLKRPLLRQLAQRGIAAQFASIRLDLFRGVVATGAALADATAPEQTLAQIDELELKFNLRRLLRGQPTILDAIRIANAVLSVPTPPDEHGAEQFTASDAYATFRFEDDGTIGIDRLTGLYCGIQLNVTGRLKPRAITETPPPPEKPAEQRSPFVFVTKTVRELNRIHVTRPPQLDLDFDVELARPLAGRATIRLRGSAIEYRNVHIDHAAVDIEMNDGAIEFHQCLARLNGGEIAITGRYDIAMGRFDLQFSSSTDPTGFAPLLPPAWADALRELHVRENPTIVARYRLSPETGPQPQLLGFVHTGPLSMRGVPFDCIRFDFEHHGPDLQLAGIEILAAGGVLTGQLRYNIEKRSFQYQLHSTLDPVPLLPLLPRFMKRIVEPAAFGTPPEITAVVEGTFLNPTALAYDVQIRAGRCRYRGVALETVSATLQLRHSRLNVPDLYIKRPEGTLQGRLLADFAQPRLEFKLDSTANPGALAALLGEDAARAMAPYRFGPSTVGRAEGVIDFEDQSRSAWSAELFNEGFSYWKFTADRLRAQLLFTNSTLRVENFEADFYDGKLQGRAEFAFASPQVHYRFDVHAERADLNKMLHAMTGKPSRVTGLLNAAVHLQGRGNDPATLSGSGHLDISDGVLWEAPLFGIFSQILGTTKATSARATFSIADKTVRTDDLEIAAGAFTARSHGELQFNGKLDFRVQAQFLRAWPGIGWIGRILGQILEYKVGGTLADPSYRPVNLPKELLPHG
jgi:hypothetical protein